MPTRLLTDAELAQLSGYPSAIVAEDLTTLLRRTRALLNAEQVAQLRQRVAEGSSKASLAREYGISRETVYQYLRASS